MFACLTRPGAAWACRPPNVMPRVNGAVGLAQPVTPATSTNTSSTAQRSAPAPVSGVAFTPSANADCMLYLTFTTATTLTFALTIGPTTGGENSIYPNLATYNGAVQNFAVRVPAGWKVVATWATGALAAGGVVVVTC